MKSTAFVQLIILILIASLTAYLAKGRGRSASLWFFIGMMFSIFGMLALFFLPVVKDESGNNEESKKIPPKPSIDSVPSKEWYYLDAQHKQFGPVPQQTLKKLYDDRTISASTYVWCKGMQEWKKVNMVDQIIPAIDN